MDSPVSGLAGYRLGHYGAQVECKAAQAAVTRSSIPRAKQACQRATGHALREEFGYRIAISA